MQIGRLVWDVRAVKGVTRRDEGAVVRALVGYSGVLHGDLCAGVSKREGRMSERAQMTRV